MVLPPPAPHDEAHPDDEPWLDGLKLSLELAPRGILLLVDQARPEMLGELVRALLPHYPELEVYTEVGHLLTVPHGSTLVFVPRAEDADWLNLNRPLFARQALRVILFCDTETSRVLAQQAVDFFDWISHQVECPAAPPRHAVAGLRWAHRVQAPGIAWKGGDLGAAFAAALPGERLQYVSASLPYDKLVEAVQEHPADWLACTDVNSPHRLWRVQQVLEEERHRTKAILVEPQVDSLWWWPVHARVADLRVARARLEQEGARYPGRLATLVDLEPEALAVMVVLQRHGPDERTLTEALVRAEDPGAVLGPLAESNGLKFPADFLSYQTPAPVTRGLVTTRDALLRQLRRRVAWHNVAPDRSWGYSELFMPVGHMKELEELMDSEQRHSPMLEAPQERQFQEYEERLHLEEALKRLPEEQQELFLLAMNGDIKSLTSRQRMILYRTIKELKDLVTQDEPD